MITGTDPSISKAKPQPMPRFDGAGRFQLALDADVRYRAIVAGALLLAAFAGSAMGSLSYRAGLPCTALWSLMAAGLVARCSARRPGGRLEREAAVILVGAAGLVGVAASFGEGLSGWRVVAVILGAALTGFAFLLPMPRWLVGVVLILAGVVAGLWLGHSFGRSGEVWAGPLGGVAAALCLASTFRRGVGVDALSAAVRLVAIGWALFSWGSLGRKAFAPDLTLIALILVLAVDVWIDKRQSFAGVVAAAVFLHLAALPPQEELFVGLLWVQPLFAVAVLALLVMAGWQFTGATLVRQPAVTYRIAPLCVVPRLDRGLDHPVKISVA